MAQDLDDYLTSPEHAAINHSGIPGVGGGLPAGVVIDFAGTVAPSGFVACDGTSYTTAGQPTLFAAIGYVWGGAGPNFNVPNLNRRTTVGSGGAASGTLGNTVGSIGGEEAHVQTTAEMANHGHSNSGTHDHATTTLNSGVIATDAGPGGATFILIASARTVGGATGSATSISGANITVNNNGSSNAANVIQPSAVVMKIIKT